MDRNLHVPYFPQAPRHIAPVDQYFWETKDNNQYMAYNGISHPIYSCNGSINYTLPLEMYPPVDDVHPQIKMVRRMHLNQRGPNPVYETPPTVQDYHDGYVPAKTGWGPHMSSRVEDFQHPGVVTTAHSGSTGRQKLGPLDELDMEMHRLEGFYTRGHYEQSPALDKRYQSNGLAPYFQQGGRDGSRIGGKMGTLNQQAPGYKMRYGQQGPSSSRFIESTMVTQPGKLPDPSGYAAGCSACSGCPAR